MYSTTFIPTKDKHTVNIPEEFYGKEVIVEVKDNEIQTTDSSRLNKLKKNQKCF